MLFAECIKGNSGFKFYYWLSAKCEKQMNGCKNTCASQTSITNWNSIKWGKVIYQVERLQRRIAKAVRDKKFAKAKSLMFILSKSFYAKLLSVFRITKNKGGKTAGIDRVVWKNNTDKFQAALSLKIRGYKPKPLRRIYIRKKNGKKRPLSIPTMHDRSMQALFRMALEPWAETTADPNSYGFRLRRSCADAVEQNFIVMAKKFHAKWVLEADIKACFDEISHEWILKNIPMNKTILNRWLKAGYIENHKKFTTEKGTPQGGIISPTIMNMVLDGLEKAIRLEFPKWKNSKVNFIRYADDFIITSPDEKTIKETIIPLVVNFLKERGLRLSTEKTKITHIDDGFDFLSQNLRKYKGKLLIRPSKDSIQSFKDKIKRALKENKGIPMHALIRIVNPIIRGWSNYHKSICAKKTFSKLAHFIYNQFWKWAKYQHGNQNRRWIFNRYFKNNHISDRYQTKNELATIRLYRIAYVPIDYQVKIRAVANPYLPEFDKYFKNRIRKRKQLAQKCQQKTILLEKKTNSRVSRR